MRAAAGQVPDEPRVDRAEQQLARLSARPCAGHVLEHPMKLCTGKICIQQKPGLFPEQRFKPFCAEQIAVFRRAPALPDDCRADGRAGFFIPNDDRFPLVCDADGRDVPRCGARLFKRFARHLKLYGKDLLCVVLYPAGLGVMLGKFPLCDLHERLLPVEQDGAA